MYKIYKITNKKRPSEIYVGSSKQTLEKRLQGHVYDKRSSVYQYIQRDGKENFEIVAIDYANNKKEAIEKETFWTIFFKEQGYFMYNKQAGNTLTQETKEKLRIANKGRCLSEETRRKMSETRKGENSPWFGKHLSKSTKYKLRKKNGKAVRCINDGKCFVSCTEAAEYYNIRVNDISKNCRGKVKSTKGFHFEYV